MLIGQGIKKEKYLIIHMDDMGTSYAANIAGIRLFEKGIANSASVIVSGPWAHDFIKWCKNNSSFDVGIHFAHTCEWEYNRWRPLCDISCVPDLFDADGFMHRGFSNELLSVPQEQVRMEMEKQFSQALMWGLKPTHVDSHMCINTLKPEFFKEYIRIAQKYDVIADIPEWVKVNKQMSEVSSKCNYPIKNAAISTGDSIDYETKKQQLIRNLEGVDYGLNVLTVHPIIETDEIKHIIPSWEERLMEYRLLLDDDILNAIRVLDIRLITWQEIAKLCKTLNYT